MNNNGLTQEEIVKIKDSIESFILPKGTLLYRAQSEKHDFDVKPKTMKIQENLELILPIPLI